MPAERLAASTADLGLHAHRVRAAIEAQHERLRAARGAVSTISEAAAGAAVEVGEAAASAARARDGARGSGELVGRVAGELERAAQAAASSLELLEELTARVAEVRGIATAIEEIAGRSKLLALNARIEAARAGEHGRGFDVVAGEVGALAERTADEVRSIRELVDAIERSSERSAESTEAVRAGAAGLREGIDDARRAGEELERIVAEVSALSSTIEAVSERASEQARAAELVASDVEALAAGGASTVTSAETLVSSAIVIDHATDAIGAAAIATAAIDASPPEGRARADAAAAALEGVAKALRPLFDVPREHAGRLLALAAGKRAARGGLRRADLGALDDPMRANLERFAAELCGATVTMAPGALLDDRLWMQWWVNGTAGPEPLVPDFDPASPDFYDYTTDDWYTSPVARGGTWLSDPYFDEGGADAEIVTVSTPVLDGGELLGVTTIDLQLAQVASLCAGPIRSAGARAALVSEGGVLVASSDPAALPPGQPVGERSDWIARSRGPWSEAEDGAALARSPTLDWALLILPG